MDSIRKCDPKSKVFVGILSFLAGVGATLGGQAFHGKFFPKSVNTVARNPLDFHSQMLQRDPFLQFSQDPFKVFEQPFFLQGFGANPWNVTTLGEAVGVGEFATREDEQFVYYDVEIRGVDAEQLKVDVTREQVTISGRAEIEDKDQGTQVSSQFHRSFPAPLNVDVHKVQMEHDDDRLVLKFPKLSS